MVWTALGLRYSAYILLGIDLITQSINEEDYVLNCLYVAHSIWTIFLIGVAVLTNA